MRQHRPRRKFFMLLHRAIVERIIASECASKPYDDSAVAAFSNLVEKHLIGMAGLVLGDHVRSTGSPDVSEEALLKDLGFTGDTNRLRGTLTADEVTRILG
jgi:hypothetical protein